MDAAGCSLSGLLLLLVAVLGILSRCQSLCEIWIVWPSGTTAFLLSCGDVC
ncbi:hypothetical protein IFHNHDMJ_02131 [Synechococcus sp. CBW1107]|nr:hypothetical protein IFHNHDMJ_02131 [Synechococcus sp. CBW1107]